ncbi:interleukin-12 receptor subunit beta-2-like [Gadus morhua]|uniref:interleukin-12 receptor subunit beta-2-like n=1 Tax=Gadus morhua TaxID=8049 RepID=UPI0011B4A263|nr:interleukin-12 receptor subunit beta-2-like [Gadus morhua]
MPSPGLLTRWSGPRFLCLLAVRVMVVAATVSKGSEKTCKIWSSAGEVVERNSSFRIFCTFPFTCEMAVMAVQQPAAMAVQHHLNSSTVYIDRVQYTNSATYTCHCKPGRTSKFCGIDIVAGYPPGKHGAPTCIKSYTEVQHGFVECRWKSLTDTYLPTTSTLRVTSLSKIPTGVPMVLKGSSEGPGSFRARWSVNSSVQMISVEVLACNKLGRTGSETYNFTLSDIVKPLPPVLNLVECSSRSCNITWRHSLKPHLQVQYRDVADRMVAEEECIPHPDSDWQNSSSELPSVHSLEPSRHYCFRVRAKLNSGLWSDWSRPVHNRTQGEGKECCRFAAPNKELDIWFARATSQPNILTVYWKSLNESEARGRVLGYLVHINDNRTRSCTTHNVSANDAHLKVQSCVTCLVTVSAYNSKGSSPPARVPTLFKTAQPPQELHFTESKDNVSLYWRKADPTLQSTGYLVEWYLQDQQFEKFQWMRLSSAENQAVITEIDPYECYDGAVYVFYENALGRASFTGVNTLVRAPTGAPSVTKHGEGHEVTLTWTQIPRHQRGGCVRNYTVYVGNNTDPKRMYHVPASERQYAFGRLPPDTYIVWLTAWTEQGEGPCGEKIKFIIYRKGETNLLYWLLLATFLCIALLLCHFKLITRWQRLKTIRISLNDVPDPSNSKWAKAFTDNKTFVDSLKSKMDLNVNPSDFSSSEEVDIVTFLENPKEIVEDLGHREGLTDASSVHRPDWDSGTASQTHYIKSTDSSHYVRSSQDTGYTASYISSQAEQSVLVEGREEEEECIDFYSSKVFDEPIVFGRGLTLNAVKIDGRSLWENDC